MSTQHKAEIHTLETESWRCVVDMPVYKPKMKNDDPVYHNGALHWICALKDGSKAILSFDMEEERFGFYSIPSQPSQQGIVLEIGVLGGCLFVYVPLDVDPRLLDIWMMKDYGACESWTKLFRIDTTNGQQSNRIYFRYRNFRSLIYLNNSALLIINGDGDELAYYDESKVLRFKHLKFRGTITKFAAIVHTPSFISLKDIVTAGNVEVLNVNSRYVRTLFLQ